MEKTAVLAITKNGVNIGQNLKELFPDWIIFAPAKLSNENSGITTRGNQTGMTMFIGAPFRLTRH